MSNILSTKTFLWVWIVVVVGSLLIPEEQVAALWGDTRTVTITAIGWILICVLAFWMGSFIERSIFIGVKDKTSTNVNDSGAEIAVSQKKLKRGIVAVRVILLVSGSVILVRFLWTVWLLGSVADTLTLMVVDPITYKFSYWQATNIHGVGMLAELVVATTLFTTAAYALLTTYSDKNSTSSLVGYDGEDVTRLRIQTKRLMILSLVLLTFYMLVSNERLPFVAGILGALTVYYLVRRRIPIRPLFTIGLLFGVVWVFVEVGRSATMGTEGLLTMLHYAKNRLLLYFAGSVRNVDTLLQYVNDHSYGWFAFRFLLSSLALEELISLPDTIYGTGSFQIKPGMGAIPVFGTAYADFGAAGLCYFMFWGFIYQKLHRLAVIRNNFFALQVYAYFIVSILLSFMVFLPSLSRFWAVLFGLFAMNKIVKFGSGNC